MLVYHLARTERFSKAGTNWRKVFIADITNPQSFGGAHHRDDVLGLAGKMGIEMDWRAGNDVIDYMHLDPEEHPDLETAAMRAIRKVAEGNVIRATDENKVDAMPKAFFLYSAKGVFVASTEKLSEEDASKIADNCIVAREMWS